MGLVVFNYSRGKDGELTNFVEDVDIPQHLHKVRWTLRAINVLKMDTSRLNLAYIEVEFPDLINNENTLFSYSGDKKVPRSESFRFYRQHHQVNPRQDILVSRESVWSAISFYPNWDLGEHIIEGDKLRCIVRGYDDKDAPAAVENYSIILSTE